MAFFRTLIKITYRVAIKNSIFKKGSLHVGAIRLAEIVRPEWKGVTAASVAIEREKSIIPYQARKKGLCGVERLLPDCSFISKWPA